MNKEHIQELAEKIRNAICYLGMPTQEADKRTVELITQALNNQWVRVEDRLPEHSSNDNSIYVIGHDGTEWNKCFYCYHWMEWIGDNGKFLKIKKWKYCKD